MAYTSNEIVTAISKGLVDEAITLINSCTEIDQEIAVAALHIASQYGYVEIVRLLLNHSFDINTIGIRGTALSLAAFYRHIDIMKLLLESGANPNIVDRFDTTPLSQIVRYDNIELVKLFLNHGADVDLPDIYGLTPLANAFSHADPKIIRILLDAGADPNIFHQNANFWFGFYYKNKNMIDNMKLLINAGANVDVVPTSRSVPIISAAAYGYDDMILLLLEAGANINAVDKSGSTALHRAIVNKQNKTVELLLSKGADPNIADSSIYMSYSTALHLACIYNIAVKQLIDAGADINAIDIKGHTCLHLSVQHENDDAVVRLLLEYGADINAREKRGITPLLRAVGLGNKIIAKTLVILGADVTLPDENGVSPLTLAEKLGNEWFKEILLHS